MKFKSTIKRTLILLAIHVSWLSASAQDIHFSQFFNTPLLTNPANTGFIPDADYRIGASYRNQYSAIMAVPYKTISSTSHWMQLDKPDDFNKIIDDFLKVVEKK